MKLSNLQLLELQTAIQHISQVNKDSGFPIYDLGYKFNMAMAMAITKIKTPIAVFDGKANKTKMRQEAPALRAIIQDKTAPPEKQVAAAARIAVIEPEWQALLAETVEVELPSPMAASEIQCKGMTPTPEILAMLTPLFA
jgi:hypothetical protein